MTPSVVAGPEMKSGDALGSDKAACREAKWCGSTWEAIALSGMLSDSAEG